MGDASTTLAPAARAGLDVPSSRSPAVDWSSCCHSFEDSHEALVFEIVGPSNAFDVVDLTGPKPNQPPIGPAGELDPIVVSMVE